MEKSINYYSYQQRCMVQKKKKKKKNSPIVQVSSVYIPLTILHFTVLKSTLTLEYLSGCVVFTHFDGSLQQDSGTILLAICAAFQLDVK